MLLIWLCCTLAYSTPLGTAQANDSIRENTAIPPEWAPSSWIQLRGYVSNLTEENRFTLSTEWREFEIDTSELPYNPALDESNQQIEMSDYIQVTGHVVDHFLRGPSIRAITITTLFEDHPN